MKINNIVVRPITVVSGDLTLTVNNNPTNLFTNTQINLTCEITNQINSSICSNTKFRIYLSPNQTLDNSDAILFTSTINSLAGNTSTNIQANINVPNVALGSYYLIYKADADNQTGEVDENE